MSTNPTEQTVVSAIAIGVAVINVPVIVLIFVSPSLKKCKELVLIGGVCGVDAVQNLFNAVLTLDRFISFPNGTDLMVPALACFFKYYVFIIFYTQIMVGIMTFLVSLERCIVVFFPIWYTVSYTRTTALLMMLGSLIFCFILHIVCYLLLVSAPPTNVSILCYASSVYPPLASNLLTSLRISISAIGIGLYVPITLRICQLKVAEYKRVFVSSKSSFSSTANAKKEAEAQRKKNIRFSVTIGMTCLSDLILLFIPDIIINYDLFGLHAYHLFFARAGLIKTVLNLFIYTLRHNELRKEVMTRLRLCH
uniref:G_PROTEIN_RECEP_F1_2 domain-containing protein n=1 Tax=Steinernema glaseri TaxID=37863 RepID=A0A1I8ASQ1_9BILA